MPTARRTLLTGGAAGVGLVVAGAVPTLAQASPQDRRPDPAGRPGHRPFPALIDDPRGLLALPPGFQYEVVTYAGRTKLDDGKGDTPSNHDGTAVFEGRRGRLLLIQNHETARRLTPRRPARGGHGLRPDRAHGRRVHRHRDRPARSATTASGSGSPARSRTARVARARGVPG